MGSEAKLKATKGTGLKRLTPRQMLQRLPIVGNTRMYFLFEEAKETVSDFSQGTVKFCKCNSIQCNFVK